MKQKDILFIGATHGDEPIGVEALATRSRSSLARKFDWIIGNELAYPLNRRGYTGDLNRSAPGELGSGIYEKRRAAEILQLAKNYRGVIDLHGSRKKTGIFIIITNPTLVNFQLAARLPIPRLVIWPSLDPSLKGPLSEYFPCGLEIECGPKSSAGLKRQLQKTLRKFLVARDRREGRSLARALAEKEIFQVYGALRTKPPARTRLKEFTAARFGTRVFYPLLIGSYQKIICYQMRKLNGRTLLRSLRK